MCKTYVESNITYFMKNCLKQIYHLPKCINYVTVNMYLLMNPSLYFLF